MLENSPEIFIDRSTSRDFLDTLENLLRSPETDPVVKERVMEVVLAAAYASHRRADKNTGFLDLWKKVKPFEKPDEGMPVDNNDPISKSPVLVKGPSSQNSDIDNGQDIDGVRAGGSSSINEDDVIASSAQFTEGKELQSVHDEEGWKRLSEHEQGYLYQECVMGKGNAGLLNKALAHISPGDFDRGGKIKEFHLKCISSQVSITAQIPWVTAIATRSRSRRILGQDVKETVEEKLLRDLLAANEELTSVLRKFEELERVAIETKAEEKGKNIIGRTGRRAGFERQQDSGTLDDSSSSCDGSPPSGDIERGSSVFYTPSKSKLLSTSPRQPRHFAPSAAPRGPRRPRLRTPQNPREGTNILKRLSIPDQITLIDHDEDSPIIPSEMRQGGEGILIVKRTNGGFQVLTARY